MRARPTSLLLTLLCSAGVAQHAAAQEACPPMEQAIRAIVATEARARADVTAQMSCYFPIGLSFNDAAIRLDQNRFGLLNRTEPMFFRWRIDGEEFVSRRVIPGFWSNAEIWITIHTANKRINRFAAQYFSGQQ
ncbi:hypothetical protein [Hansschlegelia plantiphila]|uniref:DUF3019 domain-containing protein n=1 Tax=Hansschlegelia plantiphila TaxID=374655 RepID=A0A9W6IXZ3_9HYPH|nr:hypothetical protein [Hansschlegelia plantiphila]GLK67230.1 hypothetical protein GCM10008179_08680 [Hansschlegelia plantiphila]